MDKKKEDLIVVDRKENRFQEFLNMMVILKLKVHLKDGLNLRNLPACLEKTY